MQYRCVHRKGRTDVFKVQFPFILGWIGLLCCADVYDMAFGNKLSRADFRNKKQTLNIQKVKQTLVSGNIIGQFLFHGAV